MDETCPHMFMRKSKNSRKPDHFVTWLFFRYKGVENYSQQAECGRKMAVKWINILYKATKRILLSFKDYVI